MLELVSDVLDMSKLEAGMFEIHEDVFDMNELMDEVAALVDAQLVESGITHCKHRSNIQHTALKEAPAAAAYHGQSSEQCNQI